MQKQIDYTELAGNIRTWANELGFQQAGITSTDLSEDESHLLNWLDQGMHGEMAYMDKHGTARSRPSELVPGTCRIISLRMDYDPPDSTHPKIALDNPEVGYVSRYALGRDYHKVIRTKLQNLATRIESVAGQFGYRAFVDSAPVLEKALARNAGLGWFGKHSNLINPQAGSWFFLGELYTDLPLPIDESFDKAHCGSCDACMTVCPTQAIIAPYQVDARRCISYLTIELRGSIPVEFRPLMGNRIYGCDDCQLICPWNRFAKNTEEQDFRARHGLDAPQLLELFQWNEDEFLKRTEGSAIRRIGYECWLRNIAVALGNAPTTPETVNALRSRLEHPSELVREHVQWAIEQHVGS
ncbi:MAG: tRNA epoxyqueuosine(34) reductase QueG [Gammaproteobacteria bacterium]|nr:tRNA epoxyqueuosine(34) reductase QueG [Gammaproteobacteria bacterium]